MNMPSYETCYHDRTHWATGEIKILFSICHTIVTLLLHTLKLLGIHVSYIRTYVVIACVYTCLYPYHLCMGAFTGYKMICMVTILNSWCTKA